MRRALQRPLCDSSLQRFHPIQYIHGIYIICGTCSALVHAEPQPGGRGAGAHVPPRRSAHLRSAPAPAAAPAGCPRTPRRRTGTWPPRQSPGRRSRAPPAGPRPPARPARTATIRRLVSLAGRGALTGAGRPRICLPFTLGAQACLGMVTAQQMWCMPCQFDSSCRSSPHATSATAVNSSFARTGHRACAHPDCKATHGAQPISQG